MGRKDDYQFGYLDDNTRFADQINGALFPRAMSQVPCVHEHLANAARVKYPVAGYLT